MIKWNYTVRKWDLTVQKLEKGMVFKPCILECAKKNWGEYDAVTKKREREINNAVKCPFKWKILTQLLLQR